MDGVQRDRAYFNALMDDARDGILVLDVLRGADGKAEGFVCKTASLSGENLVGSKIGDLTGQSVFDLFPEDLAAQLAVDLTQVADKGEVFDSFERCELKDGEHWLHVLARPFDRDTVLLVLMDASATRRFNLKNKDLAGELEDLKSSNKRVFSALSYELRTPLNTVIGFADMISGEIFGPLGVPQYKDYVNDIARSGRQMLKTVDGLLEQEMVKDIVKEGREYRSIIELAPDLMSICRDGVIEMINPVAPACSRSGRSRNWKAVNLPISSIPIIGRWSKREWRRLRKKGKRFPASSSTPNSGSSMWKCRRSPIICGVSGGR